MISLPPNIRIGLAPAAKRAKKKKEAERRAKGAPGAHWGKRKSVSCGVHPSQVERERQFIKDFGIPSTEVDNNGDITFKSRAGQKQYIKYRNGPSGGNMFNADETS